MSNRCPPPQGARPPGEAAVDDLEHLHDEIDVSAARLTRVHAVRLRCAPGCSTCCTDGLTIFAVEAARIRRSCGAILREGPHAPGRCAFLSGDDLCRIYAHRPYVCRTQGLPLRFFDLSADGETVEYRDICPSNEPGGADLSALADDALWTIGPHEGRLASLQMAFEGRLRRVPLRALFNDATAWPASTASDDDERERSASPGAAATRSRR